MKLEIKTLDEMRDEDIVTDQYSANLEEGSFSARLVMLAECTKVGTFRAFFKFDDGRDVFALLQYFNRYLGILSVEPGAHILISYRKYEKGVFPYKIEVIE